jgi:hypothetical protein
LTKFWSSKTYSAGKIFLSAEDPWPAWVTIFLKKSETDTEYTEGVEKFRHLKLSDIKDLHYICGRVIEDMKGFDVE